MMLYQYRRLRECTADVFVAHSDDSCIFVLLYVQVASTVCYRLLLQPCVNNKANMMSAGASTTISNNGNSSSNSNHNSPTMFCPSTLRTLIRSSMDLEVTEMGHTMSHAVREDALAYVRRDPAIDTILEVVLFSKGFAAQVRF